MDGWMDGWMNELGFYVPSTVFQSFRDDRKENEKNALLTEQNERQVLFCTVTSRLLHDDAKIHATSTRLYNVLENWREMKTVFRRNILIRTGDLLILFYVSIRYD